MKTVIAGLFITLFLPLGLWAQEDDFVVLKGGCMPDVTSDAAAGGSKRAHRYLPSRRTDWDAAKTYKQMVILFTFTDTDFSMEGGNAKANEFYNKMFNEAGYKLYSGKGCVADYFREQSGGLANFVFDVYGPVQVNSKAVGVENPTEDTKFDGDSLMREATRKVLEANLTVDYSQYDWNGDGTIEQVVYIYAGVPGNISSTECYGHIWPNTKNFPTLTTPDGKKISNYTASGEKWPTNTYRPFGLGTVCHEFSHSLGLPDIYPVDNSSIISAVDEWDLMDGGNFTNYGWCPPNYSSLEKMLMGWLTPTELTEAATITDMKPVSEGGAVYQIKKSDTEYLLLENRQWTGWDAGLPGKGLAVFSVNYDDAAWSDNSVNSFSSEASFRYKMVHADGLTYGGWVDKKKADNLPNYQNSLRMNSYLLSTSPFPYNTNAKCELIAGKSVTNIQQHTDGTVSFDFMGGTSSAVEAVRTAADRRVEAVYDLAGRRVQTPVAGRLYIVRLANGETVKYHKK